MRDIWVGDREVRPSLNEIRLGMERVHIEPRSMEVLGELVRNAPEVVPKERLIAAVWGDAIVTDEVLTHAIWDLRRAFGDNASNPEFIQTIPKKGYRLIAPVQELERDGGAGRSPKPAAVSRRPRVRTWIWVLALLTVVAVAALRLGRRPAPRPPAAAIPTVLTVVATEPFAGTDQLAERLDRTLLNELAGLPDVDTVRRGAACEAVAGADSYCLETALLTGTELYEMSATLIDADTREVVYSPPPRQPGGRSEVTAAAREIAAQISTFFEIHRDPLLRDPDIAPWIRLQRYDIRAIRDFLHGIKYVYRHETGAGKEMRSAFERDPAFVAPRVWFTTALLGAEPAARAEHREALERQWEHAGPFEKAMIRWALALLDGSLPEQIRHLRVALQEEPANRQVLLALASAHMGQGEYDRAWQLLEPLVEERWQFPGLYPVAGRCALHAGNLEQAAFALEAAIETDPVDPESLALLRLLAVYRGDEAEEARYRGWLEQRLREMEPEAVALDLAEHAERLAARADSEGRSAIAARLRESAG